MRVLIVNKYYYYKGGDCTYALELERLLKAQGHEVAFFSMLGDKNFDSEYEKYFVSEVDFKAKSKELAKIIKRPFGDKEVNQKFTQLMDDFQPEIIHLHNIHSHISPSILKIARDRNVSVVWTVHDYKLLCPVYTFRRDGRPCELCLTNKINVVKHKCMSNSIAASMLAYLEAEYWNLDKILQLVDLFLPPSMFMYNKLREGGAPEEKLVHLPYFISEKRGISETIPSPLPKTYTYLGRLVPEKGIETLLEAAKDLEYTLNVIGDGPMFDELKLKYKQNNIIFHGYLNWEQMLPILMQSNFTVTPSEWYENYPFSIIESLSLGIPVLGSSIGGIPELIDERFSGMLFTPFDKNSLSLKITEMFSLNLIVNYEKIRQNLREMLSQKHHLEILEDIYKGLIETKTKKHSLKAQLS